MLQPSARTPSQREPYQYNGWLNEEQPPHRPTQYRRTPAQCAVPPTKPTESTGPTGPTGPTIQWSGTTNASTCADAKFANGTAHPAQRATRTTNATVPDDAADAVYPDATNAVRANDASNATAAGVQHAAHANDDNDEWNAGAFHVKVRGGPHV